MKKNILICDDKKENRDAAQAALDMYKTGTNALNLDETIVLDKAKDAIDALSRADFVLTDFLFEGKEEAIHQAYLDQYVGGIQYTYDAKQVLRNIRCEELGLRDRIHESRIKMNTLTMELGHVPLEKYLRSLEERFGFEDTNTALEGIFTTGDMFRFAASINTPRFMRELLDKNFQGLYPGEQVPNKDIDRMVNSLYPKGQPEFCYGGLVYQQAQQAGKETLLVTNLHRHAIGGEPESMAQALDGWYAFLPLANQGLISHEESAYAAERDGQHIYTRGSLDKTNPKTWLTCLERLEK